MSPRVYNALILQTINTVPTENSTFIADYLLKPDEGNRIHRKVKAELPLAIRPTKNSSRILAQRGVFTIHGNKSICINELLETIPLVNKNETLNYIDISGRHKSKILKELFQSGISHSVLFPELTGISQELLVRYTEFYQH